VPFINSVRGTLGASGLTLSRGRFATYTIGQPSEFLSGGAQSFSPGYFGVSNADSFIIPNNSILESVTFRRTQTAAYHWWVLVCTRSGNTYTQVYGALISVPTGGSAGDVITTNLSSAVTSFGSTTIPSSGSYYLGWHSGTGGYVGTTQSSASMFWSSSFPDMGAYAGRAELSWRHANDIYPQLNQSITTGTSYNGQGGYNYHAAGIHIALNCKKLINSTAVLDGSAPEKAATSALAIKNLTGTTTNGYYWIKPTGYSVPRYIYCDMSTSGGGWMLIGWHGGNATGANSHVGDAEWNTNHALGSGAYANASLSTAAPSTSDSFGVGYKFVQSLVVNNRSTCTFAARWNAGGTVPAGSANTIWYYNTDSTADWDRYDTRAAQSPSYNSSDSRHAWLRTGYISYTTSGRGGAGGGTGTTATFGGSTWGVHPFNMNSSAPDTAGNHGIAITGYYNSGTASSPNYVTEYYGGHMGTSDGSWGRPIALWIKVA
jgi:hypothetical protein